MDKYRYIDVLRTNKGNILQTSSEISEQVTNRLSKAHRKHIGCNVARRFHNRCAKGQDYGNNPRSRKAMTVDSIQESWVYVIMVNSTRL